MIVCTALIVVSCKDKVTSNQEAARTALEHTKMVQDIAYESFGKTFPLPDAISAKHMAARYADLPVGDSIAVKMTAKVKDVCQAKGCWMTLDLLDDQEVMVKFENYGFFVPKDISGKEVFINGKAFVNEVSVDEQRHYAQDAGATAEEIAKITAPKTTYSFMAEGVLLNVK
jgi:hypothetical protein